MNKHAKALDQRANQEGSRCKKCNGSLDAATEDLSLEKAMDVARQKNDDGHLTRADLKAQTREVIGTCVAMRVKIDGLWAKDALKTIENGDWDERFA